MQVIKRAKGDASEIVPASVPEKDIKEEVTKRNAKAGYTTRYGECPYRTKIQSRGFGESKINVWPRDKHGNLIGD